MSAERERDALYEALRDIAFGASLMLQPPCDVNTLLSRYAKEVERIAQAGLLEAKRIRKELADGRRA